MLDTTIVDCQRNKNNMFDTTFVSVASRVLFTSEKLPVLDLLQQDKDHVISKRHKSRQLDNNVIIYGCVQYIYI